MAFVRGAPARARSAVAGACIAALLVGGLTIAVVSAGARPAAADSAQPWWWNGRVCDAGRNSGSHPLAASYLGVQVCGPQPYLYNGGDSFAIVEEGPDPNHVFGEGEWQCVELAMRFMALVYGVQPYGADGGNVVDNYSPADGGALVKYRNATPGVAPLPGDILGFTMSGGLGHVGVVTDSAVDANGNGAIVMLSQNDTDDGWRTLAVTNWSVASWNRHNASGWLHDPAGRGDPSGSARTTASITARPGGGYWSVTPNGRVAAAGTRPLGDLASSALNAPIVDIAATPTGRGYWLLAGDGGIFTFGDARFYGSTGALTLNRPIVAMAPTPTGHGYWLAATDGGIFSFGDAQFHGSTGALTLAHPISGMARSDNGRGYRLIEADGLKVHEFGAGAG
jgi:hypothetical protein